MKSLIIVLGLTAVAMAQQQKYYGNSNQFAQPTTTPVPILKQINRHNDDGSYSFGYEAADGSFKIETKHTNGEVYGKYGYVDSDGKTREVEYGASKQRGFEPVGTDINVPPVTTDEQNYSADIRPLGPGEEDDGQYREDPSIYWKDARYNQAAAPAQKKAPRPQYYQQPQQVSAPQQYEEEEYEQPQQQQYQAPQHRFQYAQQREQQPRQYYQQPQAVQQPKYYQGQPQPGYDINTGSYTISYSG